MRVKLHIPEESILWLECTIDEATNIVYPLLSKDQIVESKKYVVQIMEGWKVGEEEDNSKHPHDIYCKKIIKYPVCFNIHGNLTKIEPLPANVPYSHMWNGYSPYELIDAMYFSDLTELSGYMEQ